ncbi:MAG: hypothetical protein ACUVS1_09990 [Actinomycetota bacterium]
MKERREERKCLSRAKNRGDISGQISRKSPVGGLRRKRKGGKIVGRRPGRKPSGVPLDDEDMAFIPRRLVAALERVGRMKARLPERFVRSYVDAICAAHGVPNRSGLSFVPPGRGHAEHKDLLPFPHILGPAPRGAGYHTLAEVEEAIIRSADEIEAALRYVDKVLRRVYRRLEAEGELLEKLLDR